MSRGDRREDLYLNVVDRQDFLKTLAEACQKAARQVHACCLVRNHLRNSSGESKDNLANIPLELCIPTVPRRALNGSSAKSSVDWAML